MLRSIREWLASSAGLTLSIRVNPSSPTDYVVISRLPVNHEDNADDFTNAGIIMGGVSLGMLAVARALVRRGW